MASAGKNWTSAYGRRSPLPAASLACQYTTLPRPAAASGSRRASPAVTLTRSATTAASIPMKTTSWATRGTAASSAAAATARPASTPPKVPRLIQYTLRGYSTMAALRPPDASGAQVGEEGLLARGHRAGAAGAPLAPRGRLRGWRRALALGAGPALLMRDLVALLDHEEIDEPCRRVGQQLEVFGPVARRVGESLHLVYREGERGPVTPAGRQPQQLEHARTADARRASHALPSSRRSMWAASTIERSLETPTHRGVSQSPQSGTSHKRSGGRCLSAWRARSATSSAVSTRKALTSMTPTATSLSLGNSLQSSISLISRLAYSKTNCCTRASSSSGKSGR